MKNWKKVAHAVEDECGMFVDWDECYFICPECGEPVYEEDWKDSNFTLGEKGKWYCPICETVIVEK